MLVELLINFMYYVILAVDEFKHYMKCNKTLLLNYLFLKASRKTGISANVKS